MSKKFIWSINRNFVKIRPGNVMEDNGGGAN